MSEWLSMEDAPRDGTVVLALVNGDEWLIRWAEERRCMLAYVQPGAGLYGPGWEQAVESLVITDEPDGWRPVEEAKRAER